MMKYHMNSVFIIVVLYHHPGFCKLYFVKQQDAIGSLNINRCEFQGSDLC